MAVYCLCKGTELAYMIEQDSLNKIILDVPMNCIKTGAETFYSYFTGTNNMPAIEPGFKNVDIFECSNCGAKVAKD